MIQNYQLLIVRKQITNCVVLAELSYVVLHFLDDLLILGLPPLLMFLLAAPSALPLLLLSLRLRLSGALAWGASASGARGEQGRPRGLHHRPGDSERTQGAFGNEAGPSEPVGISLSTGG